MMSELEMEMDQEITQSNMEMEDNELQEILDRENLDLEGFLGKVTTGGIESLPQEECNRIKQLFLWKTREKGAKEVNNIERQRNQGVKAIKTTPRLALINRGKKKRQKKKIKF